ncbi:heparinase II/III family protein [Candidatus Sumerlaeota bacterium]|nr:heparinase II/III family protein [Candidatus Sumerlaeota bacterium]
MKRALAGLLAVMSVGVHNCAAGAAASPDDSWISKIRKDHPRLFFNKDTWPQVRQRALNQEKEWYSELKRRVDQYPTNPTSASRETSPAYRPTGSGRYEAVTLPKPREWGSEAMQTAFVYLMTGERKYLETAKRMLRVSAAAYHDCYQKGMGVNWYSTSRVSAFAAYDWIFNDLTPDERRDILTPLLKHVEATQPRRDRPPIYRIGTSGPHEGFYGEQNIVWFAGLAAHNDGIEDATASRFLRLGYEYNQELFRFREQCAGDDGGLASATVGYAMGAYPWSQFNFLYTWRSAIGEDVAARWPHLAYFPVWIIWNWLPGARPREFGSGDTYHYTNELPIHGLYTHMTQIMDFYGRSQPDCAALAAHIREILPADVRRYAWSYPIYPFLLSQLEKAPPPRAPQDTNVKARHFEALGQIFMRSGSGPDDTYSLFTIGSRVPSHKQHDENNFIIYKKGYLALDSGTRGSETGTQLRHYYSQTVAHNCVLIHMPGEPFPGYWGPASNEPEGKISCGGTYRTTGGKCVAFETNPHFTYVAGDATSCYRPQKCKLALRQFVFVMPNHFVICDRVVSTKAEYRKDWLLHTQNEPRVAGAQFRADEGEGRLFCRTLYPKDPVLGKIGGPGKEFFACGKNWELEPQVEKTRKAKALFGNWRIEVSPATPRTDDVLLHLIEVGGQTTASMTPSELIEKDGIVGVRFQAGQNSATVTFATRGEPTGRVRIASGEKILTEKDLAREVAPQAGLAAKP